MQDLVLLMNNDVAGCRVSWVYSEIVVPLRIFWWMAGKCTRFFFLTKTLTLNCNLKKNFFKMIFLRLLRDQLLYPMNQKGNTAFLLNFCFYFCSELKGFSVATNYTVSDKLCSLPLCLFFFPLRLKLNFVSDCRCMASSLRCSCS